jgi:3-oxoacyl-[acyl-carrier protein] reductase
MNGGRILVTGASRGLGLAITKRLLKQQNTVFAVSRTISDSLKELRHQYKNFLHTKEIDLAAPDSAAETVISEFVGYDTALTYDDLVTNVKREPLEQMFQINVFTPILLTRAIIRNFLTHKTPGSIVHISSISVHTGYKGLAMYAASKGALEAFSKNTAREWGERKIRSNAVVCGFMETAMSASLTDEQKGSIYRRTALKQATSPDSVASTVDYLLSTDSHSITGQSIHVDSGTI